MLSLVGLVIVGGIALLSKEVAAACFWGLWISTVLNALANLHSVRDGVALIREDMSPTDLPPGAKIPITLMTEKEREEKP